MDRQRKLKLKPIIPFPVCKHSSGTFQMAKAQTTTKVSRDIKTFVFFDLETTGLPEDKPNITEIGLVSIHKHILDQWNEDEVPRIMDKLVTVVKPMKPITEGASEISGLYNEDLEYHKGFDEELVEMIRIFLDRQEKPICLVAHNGNKFDYPLLRTEYDSLNLSLPDDLLCMDTLVMLRELQRDGFLPKGSNTLAKVYERLIGSRPQNSHSAEGDCIAMLRICQKLAPDFIEWANTRAVHVNQIEAMY